MAQLVVRRILTSFVHRATVCRAPKKLPIPPPQISWHRFYSVPSDMDPPDSKNGGTNDKLAGGTPTSVDEKIAGGTPTSIDEKIAGGTPTSIDEKIAGGTPTSVDDEMAGGTLGGTSTSIDKTCAYIYEKIAEGPSSIDDEEAGGIPTSSDDAKKVDLPEGFSEAAESLFDNDNMSDRSELQEGNSAMDDTYGISEGSTGDREQETYVSQDALSSIFDEEDLYRLDSVFKKPWDPRDVLEGENKGDTMNRQKDVGAYLEELEQLPILNVRCTFNNTYVDICDHTGRILTWRSAGSVGYKNSRRGTTFAAQSAGQAAALKARELGMRKVRVKLKGAGIGRQHSLKGFELGGLQIMSIQDVTPVPHNGCRPKKKRRI